MRYALIGAAGYIAERHMRAINAVGGELVLACDTHDSVGILDRYAPNCEFTCSPTQFFDRLQPMAVDAVAICTPNYLHAEHTIMTVERGVRALVEKPLATRARGVCSVDYLKRSVGAAVARVYPIVQLRHHPHVANIRDAIKDDYVEVDINYHVRRGPWYQASWKANEYLSGGIATNIGIHLFDLAIHLTGDVVGIDSARIGPRSASGRFYTERAVVNWRLSNDAERPRRRFRVGRYFLDMTDAIHSLHEDVYRDLERDIGWSIDDVARSIELVDRIKEVAK